MTMMMVGCDCDAATAQGVAPPPVRGRGLKASEEEAGCNHGRLMN